MRLIRVAHGPLDMGERESRRFQDNLTRIFADIFESVDQALGPTMAPRTQAAAARLRALRSEEGAIQYSPVLGRGVRKDC